MDIDITSTAQNVIVVCTALAAVGALITYLFRKSRALYKRCQYLAHRIELMGDLVDLQLTVNHGSSLLDKVNMIHPNHEFAKEQFQTLAQADLDHAATLADWVERFRVVERQQRFFQLLLDALLLTLPTDRQSELRLLAERIQKEVDGAA